ncbi:MAG: SH3 domain-containing protein [Cyanobacteria bacterium J06649_11]
MSGSSRPRSTIWAIIGVIIAAVSTGFVIYTWYVDRQSKDIVTLQGFLVDGDDKPLSVLKIWLTRDFGKSFDGSDSQGVFNIPNVKLHDNNKIGLVFQLRDSTVQEHSIDIPNPRIIENGVLSLGMIRVNTVAKVDTVMPVKVSEPIAEKKTIIQQVNYLAYVNTKNDPLVLRDSPTLNGGRVGHVARKEYVRVIEVVGDVVEISGRIGKWCKVEHGGRTGFVFSGYLNPSFPEEIF